VDDRLLVELLVDGDPRGLAGVYDVYADRLYAYCTTMLRDRDAAADALHDTLLVARVRAAQLRDPGRLRPWLYAIARNECLRILRDRKRTAGLDEAGDVTDENADLEAGLRAGEMRELVWAAAESLNPAEREVLELTVRHGLEGADLADALGVSANHAHALASRARGQLERALAVLIVARTGRQDCAELDGILGDWDGRLTPLLRKRVGRHLERCDICGEQRRRRVSAAALLAGVPFLIAPPQLRDRIMHDAGDLRLVSSWATLANRAGPYRPDGFPLPLKRRRPKFGPAWAAAAAVVLVLLVIGAYTMLSGPEPKKAAGETVAAGTGTTQPIATDQPTTDPPDSTVDGTTPAATTTAAAATTAAPATTTLAAPPPGQPTVTVAPPTTTRRTTVAPPPVRTTTPPRTTTTPPPPPPPVRSITVSSAPNDSFCANQNEWMADLTAQVRGGVPDSVSVSWTAEGKPQDTLFMTRNGDTWTVETPPVPSGVTVVWHATATFGRSGLDSAPDTITFRCPRGDIG